jgi:hypothetical protein
VRFDARKLRDLVTTRIVLGCGSLQTLKAISAVLRSQLHHLVYTRRRDQFPTVSPMTRLSAGFAAALLLSSAFPLLARQTVG